MQDDQAHETAAIYELFEHDKDYASQEAIPFKRKMQFLFLALMNRLQVPAVIRSLKGNHNALHRDPEEILAKCEKALDRDLLAQLKRVLNNNNPSKFKGHATADQRKENRVYGNHASISKNIEKVNKTMNKEERNKLLGVFPVWLERFIPHMHLTPQDLLTKMRKKDRLVFDAAHLVSPFSICINDFTKVEDEIELQYGKTFKGYLKRIYNLRITYRFKEILLFDDDASGAFRHIKLHPDIVGAHAFIIGDTLYVPIGSVFGSNASPCNWEVIALSRTKLAEWLQTQPNIKEIEEKHEDLLNLIKFPEDAFHPKEEFIQATPDSKNKGVIVDGVHLPTQNAMFVDDNLMADTWENLRPALAASVEALFILLGFPEEELRKSPLSMDKCYESLCSYSRKQLRYLINTRELTVAITEEKREEILEILLTEWHSKRKSFTLREAASFLGLIAFFATCAAWGKYLYIALQHSIYKALKFNTRFVFESKKFQTFTKLINSKNKDIAKFFKSKTIKQIWDAKTKFFINKTLRAEVKLLTTIFSDSDTCKWEIPIRHLIDTDYDCTVLGDACLEGGGAFCDELRFWYFLEWPDNIKKRKLKAKVKHSELVSINCLEFVIIIVSYNAILDAIELLGRLHNIPHPKSLILSDNTAADS